MITRVLKEKSFDSACRSIVERRLVLILVEYVTFSSLELYLEKIWAYSSVTPVVITIMAWFPPAPPDGSLGYNNV